LKYRGNFIQGRFILPRKKVQELTSEDPGDLNRPVGVFTFSEEPVNAAVDAAKKAFPRWSALSRKKRLAYVNRFGRALKRESKTLASVITRETGKPLEESKDEVERILLKIETAHRYETPLTKTVKHRVSQDTMAYCRFRPRGVIAILSPFNVPAYLASYQIISALLSGTTVILKPSELTPFSAQILAALWQEAGLPKGAFNLTQGTGRVGQRLVNHPDVNGVLFTGSWETGSRIQERLFLEPAKFCALEMGGKNAALVCNDAKLENALQETLTGAFLTTGQRCNATSRIILEKRIAKKFIPAFLQKVDALKVGYGMEPGIFMGPLVSRKNFRHFLSHTERAKQEGFKTLRHGGALSYPKKGYYLKPSVHLREGVPRFPVREASYADREVLGPDTAIYIVRDLREAIGLNNRPPYGLVTSVFTSSRKKFETILSQAQTGLVNWNVATVRSSARMPFGGQKKSGNDRPAGFFAPYLCTIPTTSIERARA